LSPQAAEFAAPHTNAECEDEPLAPVVCVGSSEKQRGLLRGEGRQLAFLTSLGRVGPYQLGDVARDEFQLELLTERCEQELVKLALAGHAEAAGVEVVEEQAQIGGGNLLQSALAELGGDVAPEVAILNLVCGQRGRPSCFRASG